MTYQSVSFEKKWRETPPNRAGAHVDRGRDMIDTQPSPKTLLLRLGLEARLISIDESIELASAHDLGDETLPLVGVESGWVTTVEAVDANRALLGHLEAARSLLLGVEHGEFCLLAVNHSLQLSDTGFDLLVTVKGCVVGKVCGGSDVGHDMSLSLLLRFERGL